MKLVARKGLDEEEVTLLPEDAEDMVSACHFTLLAVEHRKLFTRCPSSPHHGLCITSQPQLNVRASSS